MEIVREKKKEKREKIEFIFYPIIIVRKIAIITGITGQDGSYLSEFLLDKGYEIHGLVRNKILINESLISHLILNKNNKIFLHYGDLNDINLIKSLIKKTNPDEIYNLGALSQVKASFDSPEITANINAIGALRILESIKKISMIKKIKFYQASTAELYGKVKEIPQKETTTFFPRSPYAISKLFAFWSTVNYREAYNLFAVNGILFNHESPRRRIEFVTRKITHCVASIYLNKLECFSLGNLEAKRDWGHAKDFVEVNLNVLSN